MAMGGTGIIILFVILAIAVVMNVVTFALYATDKRRAQNNQWRIKEATLLICGFLMGGIGAFLGMSLLRHKTKHIQFKILVPLAVVVNIAVVVGYLFIAGIF